MSSFAFAFADDEPFAFAGLWDRWEGPDGPVETCCILTTGANDLVQAGSRPDAGYAQSRIFRAMARSGPTGRQRAGVDATAVPERRDAGLSGVAAGEQPEE